MCALKPCLQLCYSLIRQSKDRFGAFTMSIKGSVGENLATDEDVYQQGYEGGNLQSHTSLPCNNCYRIVGLAIAFCSDLLNCCSTSSSIDNKALKEKSFFSRGER